MLKLACMICEQKVTFLDVVGSVRLFELAIGCVEAGECSQPHLVGMLLRLANIAQIKDGPAKEDINAHGTAYLRVLLKAFPNPSALELRQYHEFIETARLVPAFSKLLEQEMDSARAGQGLLPTWLRFLVLQEYSKFASRRDRREDQGSAGQQLLAHFIGQQANCERVLRLVRERLATVAEVAPLLISMRNAPASKDLVEAECRSIIHGVVKNIEELLHTPLFELSQPALAALGLPEFAALAENVANVQGLAAILKAKEPETEMQLIKIIELLVFSMLECRDADLFKRFKELLLHCHDMGEQSEHLATKLIASLSRAVASLAVSEAMLLTLAIDNLICVSGAGTRSMEGLHSRAQMQPRLHKLFWEVLDSTHKEPPPEVLSLFANKSRNPKENFGGCISYLLVKLYSFEWPTAKQLLVPDGGLNRFKLQMLSNAVDFAIENLRRIETNPSFSELGPLNAVLEFIESKSLITEREPESERANDMLMRLIGVGQEEDLDGMGGDLRGRRIEQLQERLNHPFNDGMDRLEEMLLFNHEMESLNDGRPRIPRRNSSYLDMVRREREPPEVPAQSIPHPKFKEKAVEELRRLAEAFLFSGKILEKCTKVNVFDFIAFCGRISSLA